MLRILSSKPFERALVLLDQLGLERAVAVAWHLDGDVALVSAQRFLARAVARVAGALAFRRAGLIAQVVGHLGLQSALYERTGQPFQQPILACKVLGV